VTTRHPRIRRHNFHQDVYTCFLSTSYGNPLLLNIILTYANTMLDINVAGLRDLMTSLGDLLDGPQRALAVIGRCNPSGDNSSEIIISTTSIRKWLSILQEVESFCISPQPPASGMKRREMSMAAHAEGADGTQQLEAVATVGPKRQRVRQRRYWSANPQRGWTGRGR